MGIFIAPHLRVYWNLLMFKPAFSFYQHAATLAQTFIGTGGYDFTGNLARHSSNVVKLF